MGWLLLIDKGDIRKYPAPFGPNQWNYKDKNLYAMAPDGGDSFHPAYARGGGCVLRTCGLMQELPLP